MTCFNPIIDCPSCIAFSRIKHESTWLLSVLAWRLLQHSSIFKAASSASEWIDTRPGNPAQSPTGLDLGTTIAPHDYVITDGGCAEGVGDARWRGCAGVRHRAPSEHPVLRQRRPELHPARDRLCRLSGPSRQPLLPGSCWQQRQRHNELCADKLSLGGAQQRGDIQRRDERPGAKSAHEIRRSSLLIGRRVAAVAAAADADHDDVPRSADSPVSLRKDKLMRPTFACPRVTSVVTTCREAT